ncbi:MAG TPA: SMC-Scp complex subunit ScpB [Candidatus Omnitrophota bacterium]|nr:SMC-Scp complex subunit ScpB [Candidatus Omnitrophota bacterium]HPN55554.1 SMC-Scp complex subunit ScpB [Candidatus Omnitrophota bacterium]
MTPPETDFVKNIIEAILFISENPVPFEQIHSVLEEVPLPEIRRAILDLQNEYEENSRGMIIMEIAGGYQMLSSPHYTDAIRRFFKKKVKEKLSSPALETLAIVAYKQPVSRADVEQIRGVNSDGVVAHLLSKGLIKVAGRKEIPGRPYIYGTTKQFLEYFGLKSLKDLPKLEDFPSLFTNSGEVKAEFVQERGGSSGEEPVAVPFREGEGEEGDPSVEGPPCPGHDARTEPSAGEPGDDPGLPAGESCGVPDDPVTEACVERPSPSVSPRVSDLMLEAGEGALSSRGSRLLDPDDGVLEDNDVTKETVHEPY